MEVEAEELGVEMEVQVQMQVAWRHGTGRCAGVVELLQGREVRHSQPFANRLRNVAYRELLRQEVQRVCRADVLEEDAVVLMPSPAPTRS